MDKRFGPNMNFEGAAGSLDKESPLATFSKAAFLQELHMEEFNEETMSKLPHCNQYFVEGEGEERIVNDRSNSNNENDHTVEEETLKDNFTKLPKVPLPKVRKTTKVGEPYIDYSKSI